MYGIGDTISLEHQLIEFDVCYGEYENSIFKIATYKHKGSRPFIKNARYGPKRHYGHAEQSGDTGYDESDDPESGIYYAVVHIIFIFYITYIF